MQQSSSLNSRQTGCVKVWRNKSQADPCVFYTLDEKEELMLLVSVTVDDYTVTGLEINIKLYMNEL